MSEFESRSILVISGRILLLIPSESTFSSSTSDVWSMNASEPNDALL